MNEDLVMTNDCQGKTSIDCAIAIGMWTSIRGELTKVENMVDNKISQLSNSMVKILQPGD